VRTVVIGAVAALALFLLGAGGDRAASPDGPPAAAASPAGSGTLQGRVVLDGEAPKPKKLMVVKDVAVCGKIDHLDDRIVVGGDGGLRNAVITVKGVRNGRGLASMGKEFVLDQRACAYSPHVLLVPVGAKLKILNSDGVLHNVHTFSAINRPFNVAQPKTNKKVEMTFSAPERIAVRCDVHGWMSSWVVVVGDAYSAVTDEAGRFTIGGIPPGKYTAVCWQEELGEKTFEFEVAGGKTAATEIRYAARGPAAGK
jgi:plastocyanin